jgi:hypothetical protein
MTAWNDPGNDVDSLVRMFRRIEKSLDPITPIIAAIVDRRVDRAVADLLTRFTVELTEGEIEQLRQSIRADLFELIEGLNQARAAAGALAGAFQDDVAEPVRVGRKQIEATRGLHGLAVAD